MISRRSLVKSNGYLLGGGHSTVTIWLNKDTPASVVEDMKRRVREAIPEAAHEVAFEPPEDIVEDLQFGSSSALVLPATWGAVGGVYRDLNIPEDYYASTAAHVLERDYLTRPIEELVGRQVDCASPRRFLRGWLAFEVAS